MLGGSTKLINDSKSELKTSDQDIGSLSRIMSETGHINKAF